MSKNPSAAQGGVQTGFHVSVEARDRFALADFPFTAAGAVSLEGFYAARLLANRVNTSANPMTPPAQSGKVNALGTISGILRFVFDLYVRAVKQTVVEEAAAWLEEYLGKDTFDKTCEAFAARFGSSWEVDADREPIVREMLLLWMENSNPAAAGMAGFFNDSPLRDSSAYANLMRGLRSFFQRQPPFGPRRQNLVTLLGSPARAEPNSLARQLDYIRREWGSMLGDHLLRLLSAIDLLSEEEKTRMAGPAPPEAMQLEALEGEPENYSLDRDWMPNLVLIAKNVLVWLWQLSTKYGREIRTLDQIPDEELAILAGRGITGIWLIGVWERSPVSRRIKEMTGNVNATSSAYSIFIYNVAADLGGKEALNILREKAWAVGIRLGADMVPNHTGIYSKWIVEHPDWFISSRICPFPSYSFFGENLSPDERTEILLEDHYYDRTDAAVVFKLVHKTTGDVRYVYHGNDGTVMPWNDTAQLNYLNAEVRKAVIETILHVAAQFSIIRFDAAMTLTKMHYQRLWFPEPGSGGAVPSRAEHGLSKARFNETMPHEFWREVVDRVAADAPDTLLLAEAFWLTEGYFVRTLGMHRVYNSAFMNMLREEDNEGYRKLVKDTLTFDPEILKRYVNFMNNPDEETAVTQFGKDGKYFGICTMTATMPGLPMFGHGQFEGLSEKYGAEYPRPWQDERPDEPLVHRHEQEIVPLLKKRYLFSGVSNYAFYDVFTPNGIVDENVFAYSNGVGDEMALVVYHNKWGDTTGSVRMSVPFLHKRPDGEREQKRISLVEGLRCSSDSDSFLLFRDHISGLEYVRNMRELREQGLTVRLGAYSYHVFVDFKEVTDDGEQTYARLSSFLGGAGAHSLESARIDMQLQPLHHALATLLCIETIDALPARPACDRFEVHLCSLLARILEYKRLGGDPMPFGRTAREELQSLLQVTGSVSPTEQPVPEDRGSVGFRSCLEAFSAPLLTLYVTMRATAQLLRTAGVIVRTNQWVDELRIRPILRNKLSALGISTEHIDVIVDLIVLLERHSDELPRLVPTVDLGPLFEILLHEKEMNRILEINEHNGTVWFRKERLKTLLCWMGLAVYLHCPGEDRLVCAVAWSDFIESTMDSAAAAGYRLSRFIETLRPPPPPATQQRSEPKAPPK